MTCVHSMLNLKQTQLKKERKKYNLKILESLSKVSKCCWEVGREARTAPLPSRCSRVCSHADL